MRGTLDGTMGRKTHMGIDKRHFWREGGALILGWTMISDFLSNIACSSTSFLLRTSLISRNLMTVKEFEPTTI